MLARRPDWWRQVVQWQRVRGRGREEGGVLKEPVMRWQAQERWIVWVGVDMVVVGPVGFWFFGFLVCLLILKSVSDKLKAK